MVLYHVVHTETYHFHTFGGIDHSHTYSILDEIQKIFNPFQYLSYWEYTVFNQYHSGKNHCLEPAKFSRLLHVWPSFENLILAIGTELYIKSRTPVEVVVKAPLFILKYPPQAHHQSQSPHHSIRKSVKWFVVNSTYGSHPIFITVVLVWKVREFQLSFE